MSEPTINLSSAKPGDCLRDGNGWWRSFVGRTRNEPHPFMFQALNGEPLTFAENGRYVRGHTTQSDLIAPFMAPDGGVYADEEGREWVVRASFDYWWAGDLAGEPVRGAVKFDATGKGSNGTQLVRYLRPLPEPVQLREGVWERRDVQQVDVVAMNFDPESEYHWEAVDHCGSRIPYPHDGRYRKYRKDSDYDLVKYLGQRIIVSDEQAELLTRWDIDTLAAMVDMTEDEWDHLECVRENGGVDAYLDGIPQVSDAEAQHLAYIRAVGGIDEYLAILADGIERQHEAVLSDSGRLTVNVAEQRLLKESRQAGGVEAWCERQKNLHMAMARGMRFAASDRTDDEAGWHQSLAPGEILASDGETPGVFEGPALEQKSSRPVTVTVAERRQGEANVQGYVNSQPADNERQSAEPGPVAMREGWWRLRCKAVVPVRFNAAHSIYRWELVVRDHAYSDDMTWTDDGRYIPEQDSALDCLEYLGPLDGVPMVLSEEEFGNVAQARMDGGFAEYKKRLVAAGLEAFGNQPREPQPRSLKWRHLTLTEGKTWAECGGRSDDGGEEFRQCWQEVQGAVVEYCDQQIDTPIRPYGELAGYWAFDNSDLISAARIVSLPEQSGEGA